MAWTIDRKDHFCFERTRERRGQAAPTTGDCSRANPKTTVSPGSRSSQMTRRLQIGQDRIRFLFTMLDNPPKFLKEIHSETLFPSRTIVIGDQTVWWSQTGSNRRPHACKARALPTELWPHLATEKSLASARRRIRG